VIQNQIVRVRTNVITVNSLNKTIGDIMARLRESKETLDAIRVKALLNAKELGTYNTRSSFELGRKVITFSELCHRPTRRLF
jgi:hypothetical protein